MNRDNDVPMDIDSNGENESEDEHVLFGVDVNADAEDEFGVSPPNNPQVQENSLHLLDNFNIEEEDSRGATNADSIEVFPDNDDPCDEEIYEIPDDETLSLYESDEHRAWVDIIHPRMFEMMKLCDPKIGGTRDSNYNILFAMEFPYFSEHGLNGCKIPNAVADVENDDDGINVFYWCASVNRKSAIPAMSASVDMLEAYKGCVKREYMLKIVNCLSEKPKTRQKHNKGKLDKIRRLGRVIATILNRLAIPYVLSFLKNLSGFEKIEVYGTSHSKTHPAIQFIRSALKSVTHPAMKLDLVNSGTGYEDPGVAFLTSLEENDENEEEEE